MNNTNSNFDIVFNVKNIYHFIKLKCRRIPGTTTNTKTTICMRHAITHLSVAAK